MLRTASGSVMQSLPETATAQSLRDTRSVAEPGSRFPSNEARIAAALAVAADQRALERAADMAEAASQRAADAEQRAAERAYDKAEAASQRAADAEQRAAERAYDKAEAASQCALYLADVDLLARDRICRLAGLVMAQLRRPEGKAGGDGDSNLAQSVNQDKRNSLCSNLQQGFVPGTVEEL